MRVQITEVYSGILGGGVQMPTFEQKRLTAVAITWKGGTLQHKEIDS